MELLPFIDSVSPKIRPQKLDESYADYTDHLRAVVVDALLGEKVEVPYQINFNTSPLWLLKKILEQEVNVQTVTDAEILIQSMRTLRKGMAQMKVIGDQMNFYTCWIMFHNGASYNQIFVYTDNKNAWDGSEDTVIRKIKRWVHKYNWVKFTDQQKLY
jgi:hypothetical protein